jgi:hypothetical protein
MGWIFVVCCPSMIVNFLDAPLLLHNYINFFRLIRTPSPLDWVLIGQALASHGLEKFANTTPAYLTIDQSYAAWD